VIRGLPRLSIAQRSTASAAMGDSHSILDSHQSVEETFIAFCQDKLGVDVNPRYINRAHLETGTKDSFRPGSLYASLTDALETMSMWRGKL